MKGLYLFQRYLPFIDSVWLVLYRQSDGSPILLCRPVLTFTQSKRNSLCPVLMAIGLSASESKFNPPLLVQVVLIGVYQ